MWKWLRERAVPRYAFLVTWALFMEQFLYYSGSRRGWPEHIVVSLIVGGVILLVTLVWALIWKHQHPGASREEASPKAEALGLVLGAALCVGIVVCTLLWAR